MLPPRRRPPFLLSALVAVIASIIAASGCASIASSDLSSDADGGSLNTDTKAGSPTEDAPEVYSDGGAAPPARFLGSPLCAALEGTCFPDDDASHEGDGGDATTRCDGADSGAGDAASLACRVGARGGSTAPVCEPAGVGGEGSKCEGSTDCRAGFECVRGSVASAGQCRHYCCSGSCGDVRTASGDATFCDVGELFGADSHAPVCTPVRRCTLLAPGECGAQETCSVVDESGTTSCVKVGPARAGEACESTHCATGLACLGAVGNRTCFTLCRMGGTCPSGTTCRTSTLFPDASYGVCQPE